MSQSYKLIFMGTPAFAVPALKALVEARHDICAVYTQPPRPAGRGHKLQLSPVHAYAEKLGLPVFTPINFKEEAAQQQFISHQADLAVVVAYGLILRKVILEAPRLGCINIHASLLPRWRGAAPIHRAVLAGDTETGITTMQMDEGLDTGPMLLADKIAISPTTTTPQLHDQLSQMGAALIVKTLAQLSLIKPQLQPTEGVTYAHKLTREEGQLNWQESAEMLERKVRALNPWPGTFFIYQGEIIKVLKAEIVENPTCASSGTVIDERLAIACGEQAFRPLLLQRAGKAAVEVDDFLRGMMIPQNSFVQ
jgi:methionyl-tRNA formyltransferase